MGNKNTQALNGTLNAPPAYGGATAPIVADTDVTPAVTKSANSRTPAGSTASESAVATLHLSAAIIGLLLALLWVFGGLVFRNANI